MSERLMTTRCAVGWAALSVMALSGLVGCENDGAERVLAIEAMGLLEGLVYFDANGTREPDGNDTPLAGVKVGLVVLGTRDTAVVATSDPDGLFRMDAVPVGSYVVSVDTTTVADTALVVRIDTADVTLMPDDFDRGPDRCELPDRHGCRGARITARCKSVRDRHCPQ